MTTTDAATAIADTLIAPAYPEHAALVAWLTANRQVLLSDVANGITDVDSAARMTSREFRLCMRAIPGALHDAVRAATPPAKVA